MKYEPPTQFIHKITNICIANKNLISIKFHIPIIIKYFWYVISSQTILCFFSVLFYYPVSFFSHSLYFFVYIFRIHGQHFFQYIFNNFQLHSYHFENIMKNIFCTYVHNFFKCKKNVKQTKKERQWPRASWPSHLGRCLQGAAY